MKKHSAQKGGCFFVPAIKTVAHYGVAQEAQMDPDLMSPPRLYGTFQK